LRACVAVGQIEAFDTTREAGLAFLDQNVQVSKAVERLIQGLVCPDKMDKILPEKAVKTSLTAPVFKFSPNLVAL
jgi:hypothetical protein